MCVWLLYTIKTCLPGVHLVVIKFDHIPRSHVLSLEFLDSKKWNPSSHLKVTCVKSEAKKKLIKQTNSNVFRVLYYTNLIDDCGMAFLDLSKQHNIIQVLHDNIFIYVNSINLAIFHRLLKHGN
jgi:hypothetical protein